MDSSFEQPPIVPSPTPQSHYGSRNNTYSVKELQHYTASLYGTKQSIANEPDPFDTSNFAPSHSPAQVLQDYSAINEFQQNSLSGSRASMVLENPYSKYASTAQVANESSHNNSVGFENNFTTMTESTTITEKQVPNDNIASKIESLTLNPSPVKIDQKFIQELEKNLGKKEATANSNVNEQSHYESQNNSYIPCIRPPPPSNKLSNKYQALETLRETAIMRRNTQTLQNTNNMCSSESSPQNNTYRYSANTLPSNMSSSCSSVGQDSAKVMNHSSNSSNGETKGNWKEEYQYSNNTQPSTSVTKTMHISGNEYSDYGSTAANSQDNNIRTNHTFTVMSNRPPSMIQNQTTLSEFKSNRNNTLPRPVTESVYSTYDRTVENGRRNSLMNQYSSQPVYNEINDHYSVYSSTAEVQPAYTGTYHLYSNDAPGFVEVTSAPRVYDEVFEGMYGTTLGTGVVLRPHRPAPPSPLELMQNNPQPVYQEIDA